MAKDKVLYVVTYGWSSSGSNGLMVALGSYASTGAGENFKRFETKDDLEDWMSENQEGIKNATVYEVSRVFRIKREPIKLRLVQS